MPKPRDPNSPTAFLPPDFEVAQAICARLEKGETLTAILEAEKLDPKYPSRVTFYAWLRNDQRIAEMYDKAREAGLDRIAEDCMAIAEEQIEKADAKRDPTHLAHQRLRIETRLKLLSKWSPKKFGDKVEVNGNAEQPLNVNVTSSLPPITELLDALYSQKAKSEGGK